MEEVYITTFVLVLTNLMLVLYFRYTMKREKAELLTLAVNKYEQVKEEITTPIIQGLETVTEVIGGIKDGTLSRAMSILGKNSGNVRADKASLGKFNTVVKGASPVMSQLAERFGVEPKDVLVWLNDPIIGPQAKALLGQFLGGSQEQSQQLEKSPSNIVQDMK